MNVGRLPMKGLCVPETMANPPTNNDQARRRNKVTFETNEKRNDENRQFRFGDLVYIVC